MDFLNQQIDELFTGAKWELGAFQRVVLYMDSVTLRQVYQIAKTQESSMIIRLREMEACLKHHEDYKTMLMKSGIIAEKEPWNS